LTVKFVIGLTTINNMVRIKVQIAFLILLFQPVVTYGGWSDPIRISAHGGYARPKIIASQDTLYVVAMTSTGRDKIVFIKSTDMGVSWNAERTVSDTVNTGNILFSQILRYNQKIIVLWRCHFLQNDSHNIGCRLSTNGGRTWRPISYALNPGLTGPFFFAASASDSIINIAYCKDIDGILTYYSIKSINFGQTWTSPVQVLETLYSDVPDMVSIDSTIHLVWAGFFNQQESGDVYYNRSMDNGNTWYPRIPISRPDIYPSEIASICANEDGKLTICWMDFKDSPYWSTGDIFIRQSADTGSTWLPERQATFTHYAWGSDVASNRDTIHVVWADEGAGIANESIYYTKSTDNGLNWSELYWIDGTLDNSADPNLTISNDRVYCIWVDGRYDPDTNLMGGVYLSSWTTDPDAVERDANPLPTTIQLRAYPNPFNSATTITLTGAEQAEIGIYDITGRLVTTLHTVSGQALWDASAYSSGLYFARLAGEKAGTIKLVLVK
jgi:hypothetical protein